MTSFIEIPQLSFSGDDVRPVYANVADIITLAEDYDGQTILEIRDRGSEGMSARYTSYIPLGAFLGMLQTLNDPGVGTWSESTKHTFRTPLQATIRHRREAERRQHKGESLRLDRDYDAEREAAQ